MFSSLSYLSSSSTLIHARETVRTLSISEREMQALPFQSSACSAFRSPRLHMKILLGNSKQSRKRDASMAAPRRLLLLFVGFSPIVSGTLNAPTSPVFAAPMPEIEELQVIRTFKLPSGVIIQEIVEGDGQQACEGDSVEINYVCRRRNGYFVHSTVDQFSGESMPVILQLVDDQIIKGLKEVLVGMRIRGKRRALIPPSVGYVNDKLEPVPDEFGPRRSLLSHANEPLIFEVQLLKIL